MQYSLKVDKIRVGITYPGSYSPEYKQLSGWALAVKDQEFGKGQVWNPKKCSSLTNAYVEFGHGGYLLVRYGYQAKQFRAWYEFNPSKVDFAELEGHLSLLLDYGHGSLMHRGALTYCECAVDVPDAPFEDYWFVDTRARATCAHFEAQGSLYIGGACSARSVLAYDKRKQLFDTGEGDCGQDLMRIEARVRERGTVLQDLSAVSNPFASLYVLDANHAASKLPTFLISKLGQGLTLQQAYCTLTGKQRAQVKDALPALSVSWWNPTQVWKEFPDESLGWLQQWQESSFGQNAALVQAVPTKSQVVTGPAK